MIPVVAFGRQCGPYVNSESPLSTYFYRSVIREGLKQVNEFQSIPPGNSLWF